MYTLDTVRLDKVVKALMFVSNHIRQTGDAELANRIETASYEILLSAYKDKKAFDHIAGYVASLLSISISKEYMSENTREVFATGMASVYLKRQQASEYEAHVSSILEMSVTDTERHVMQQIDKKIEVSPKVVTAASEVLVKKDKIVTVANVRNGDDKRQSSRRQEILRTLSQSPVNIKDISMHVLGCSEKTIQRELNSLVDDGVVERVGEKRWSKYVLRR